MASAELAQLELAAEVDLLRGQLERWAAEAPDWQPAAAAQALVRRLLERIDALRVRLHAPLVVATLGGTGTGKSTLVNALLGESLVAASRQRPTTTKPIMLATPGLEPAELGIDSAAVELVERPLPLLRDLVLIDCPDADTTEEAADDGQSRATFETNLVRLRAILPHCDVLLVTGTQQKYRSARVEEELAAAAAGARLVFVQTHADEDADIRDDWRAILARQYDPGRIYRVDSLAALADAQAGRAPRGDFADLKELLRQELARSARARIRRANLLDLVLATLDRAAQRFSAAWPAIDRLRQSLEEQRAILASQASAKMHADLLESRRLWEARLTGQVIARWGLSPFSIVLRAWQGLGTLLFGSLLWRVRTPAQLALWGVVAGARHLHQQWRTRLAERAAAVEAGSYVDDAQLRSAELVLEGYARDAGLRGARPERDAAQRAAAAAAQAFAGKVGGQIEALLGELAQRNSRWWARGLYEFALLAVLGVLLFRLGKNFFYDSWLAQPPAPIFGIEYYLAAGFWLVLWCAALVWLFQRRLRRGLKAELGRLAAGWRQDTWAEGLFAPLAAELDRTADYRERLMALRDSVAELRRRVAQPGLGHAHGC